MAARCDARSLIRKSPPGKLRELQKLLSGKDKAWQLLACHIRTRDGSNLRFTVDDISAIEMEGELPGRVLMELWFTDRPNLGLLRDTLARAQLYRFADFVSQDILHEGPVPRVDPNELLTEADGSTGSSTLYAQSMELMQSLPNCPANHTLQHQANAPLLGAAAPDSSHERIQFNPGEAHHFQYTQLAGWTNNFSTVPFSAGGNLLGSGGFGKVFLGRSTAEGPLMAIKKLDMSRPILKIAKQFAAEIESLGSFVHENLLGLLGYSDDMDNCCIVYEYLPNGNVEDRLACTGGKPALTVAQRVHIAKGTAQGIHYLHTHLSKPLLHRDIKTANILLDASLNAKVGDFGLARFGPSPEDRSFTVATSIIGTTIYMPYEYIKQGKVSVKTDAYSYGVVLLELLTGYPAYLKDRNDDIITYIESLDGDIEDLVDKKAGEWPLPLAEAIYSLAFGRDGCLVEMKHDRRITIAKALPEIEEWTL